MFIQHCFIRKNTPELCQRLRMLGYRQNFFDDNSGEWLAVNHGMFISVSEELEALLNGVADIAGIVHQHHFGAVMLHELFPLGAYRVGHDDAHLIAKHRADEGQADALVARGGFDNDGIGTDAALLLGLQNHIICHAGLDRAAHIQTFKLDQHLRTVGGHHTVQAD